MKKLLVPLFLLLASPALAADNYAATAGSGLTFGAKDAAGVLYSRFILCDNTTVAQCLAVDASGRLSIIPNTAMNIAQINGVTPLMGNGATGTGSQRITIANDNTIPTGWPTAANQTVVNTWASGTLGAMAAYGTSPGAVLVPGVNAFVTNTTALGQAAMAASSPVVIASNQTANALWGHGATGAAVPANATYFGFNSGGNLTGPAVATPLPVRTSDGTRTVAVHPCAAAIQSYAPISITTATTTRIVAPSASNKTYICSLLLTSAAADNVGIVEGTGGTCASGTAGVIGGTTAANGPNFAANGGMFIQAGGMVSVAQTAGTNVDLCLITSAATPLAGGINYVQAP